MNQIIHTLFHESSNSTRKTRLGEHRWHNEIGHRTGILILLGIENADTQEDADWLCRKISGLRVFDDAEGVMNRSITDAGGEALVVSQFTLMASYKKATVPRTSALPDTRWPFPSTNTFAAP